MLVCDATYFGKRTDHTSWGVIVFRDSLKKENLWWKYIEHETKRDYLEGKLFLEEKGYIIHGSTTDGFLGLSSVFEGIPFQVCQFHITARCRQLLTNNPRTEPGQVLLALAKTLSQTTPEVFGERLRMFVFKYQSFLNEKTTYESGETDYTHRNVRGALHTLTSHFKYLFTYQSVPHMPNTTNTLDGHFSHIKDIVRIHRGLSKSHKKKVLDTILLASTIAPKTTKKDGK